MSAAALTPIANGSFLITPNVGIMIWTIVVFAISYYILRRTVFPRIGEALDKRAKRIEGEIDAAEHTRQEADKILAEYRERLKEARAQSDEIVQRARQAAETHEREAKDQGRERCLARPPFVVAIVDTHGEPRFLGLLSQWRTW